MMRTCLSSLHRIQTAKSTVFHASIAEARTLLEGTFSKLWVEGEISNLACPASGHLYFTLKDASAQVSCALFKGRAQQLRFKPVEGMQVVARAKVSLYEPRGNYQLIVEQMEEAGDGALQRDFEALKQRLNQEGLFNPEHNTSNPGITRQDWRNHLSRWRGKYVTYSLY